ncbi:MAG: hypothetical protein AAF718_00225 [Pseudomonadota bacterium]
MRRKLPYLTLVLPVLGCGGGGGAANSDFGDVAGSQVSVVLNNEENGVVSDPDIGLAAFVIGASDGGRVVAQAGIAPGATVGPAATSGTASFSGTYGMWIADEIVQNDNGGVTWQEGEARGNLNLSANFGTGSVTGSGTGSSGPNSRIDVAGSISGQNMTGTVDIRYTDPSNIGRDLSADMIGRIGTNGAVGAFHASDADTAIAGGFVVD